MNEKENSELKRHTKLGRSNMTAVYGCFVNSQKTVLSKFRLGTGMMTEPEAEK